MSNEANPYLRKIDELQAARKKWASSEWLLNLLRTETGQQPRILTDEELLQWAQNLHLRSQRT